MRFCPNCGVERTADRPVCGSCGVDVRELARQMADEGEASPARALPHRSGRRVLAVLAIAALVAAGALVACSQSSSSGAPGSGTAFGTRATPEDAVRQYLAGIAAGDADQVLQACAVDNVAAHYKFDTQSERLNAMSLNNFLGPSEYRFFAVANRYQQAYRILTQARGLIYSLLSTEPLDQMVAPVSTAQVQQFVNNVDPAKLSGLSVVEVKFPVASMAGNSKALANFAAQAKDYGADELTERLALVSWNGKDYAVGFTLIRYGSDWGVLTQVSNLAGTPQTGAATPVTQSDFETATGS